MGPQGVSIRKEKKISRDAYKVSSTLILEAGRTPLDACSNFLSFFRFLLFLACFSHFSKLSGDFWSENGQTPLKINNFGVSLISMILNHQRCFNNFNFLNKYC